MEIASEISTDLKSKSLLKKAKIHFIKNKWEKHYEYLLVNLRLSTLSHKQFSTTVAAFYVSRIYLCWKPSKYGNNLNFPPH